MKRFDGMVLVSDFDGTLINGAGTVSKENIEAIRRFVTLGGLFCGATGRTQLNIGPYKEKLPVVAPWILYNGAGLYDFENERFISIDTMDGSDLIPLAKKIMKVHPEVNVQICTPDMLYLVNPSGKPDTLIVTEDQPYERCDIEAVPGAWVKLMFQGENRLLKLIEPLLDTLLDKAIHRHFFSGETYLEVVDKRISKGSGLKHLKQALTDKARIICAIGDYYNDCEMLEYADISASPENAPEDVKALADIVVSHHNDHAVADFIDWLEKNVEISIS